MMTRIVVYAHRPKRSSPKKKTKAADAAGPTTTLAPTVVVATSEKQLKRERQDRARAAQADTEGAPEIEAFFASILRPPGQE